MTEFYQLRVKERLGAHTCELLLYRFREVRVFYDGILWLFRSEFRVEAGPTSARTNITRVSTTYFEVSIADSCTDISVRLHAAHERHLPHWA